VSVSLPNTQPIYTRTPATGAVFLQNANHVANRLPGSANLPLLFEAGAAGALIECIRVVFLGNEAAREVRLYRKKADQTTPMLFSTLPINTVANIGTPTTEITWGSYAANSTAGIPNKGFLWQDIPLPDVLLGTSKTALRLEPYENVYVALSGTLTHGFNVYAIGGQYE
jgi:hypothetical protein